MKHLQIVKPTEPLLNWYPQQTQPQSTYLVLDLDSGVLTADYNHDIGDAVPMSVWHGRVRRYRLPSPYLTPDCIGAIMDELAPLFERVLAGSEIVWDGSNLVGQLDDDAAQASEAIANKLDFDRLQTELEFIEEEEEK